MEESSDATLAGDEASSRSGICADDEAARLLLARGAVVGRYLVIERIGSGAMGVVYSAYDPELDRRVALKLLHPRRAAADGRGHVRLQREAQAMARLHHGNVVTVYDVGAIEPSGRVEASATALVFVAMELVEGTTLRRWSQDLHAWREVVGLVVQAGRGLAAAHAAGLIHRDFKPENVLVDRDGRAVVTDFGLARDIDEPGSSASGTGDAEGEVPSASGWRSQLTRTGALVGTPSYMSPEQHRRAALDARADQFSFCVVLYEALYREHPFGNDSPQALIAALTRGEVSPPPAGTRVPAWIRRILIRGLQLAPADRFADMNTLLAALIDDPAMRSRRWLVLGGGALAIAGAAAGVQALRELPAVVIAPCTGASAELATVWTPARATAVHDALVAIATPYAREAADHVQTRLQGYAAEWIEGHTDACLAFEVRRDQSQQLFDRRMACLSRRRETLDLTAATLEHADAGVATRAVQTVATLPPISRCADAEALLAEVAPPEDAETAAAVAEVARDLVEVDVLVSAGKNTLGGEHADTAIVLAERSGWAQAVADAKLARASLRERTGDPAGAAVDAAASYFSAVAVGDAALAAGAASLLVRTYGLRLADFEHAEQWIPHATAWVDRIGRGTEAEAKLHLAVGWTRYRQGRFDEALAQFDARVAINEQLLGPGHYTLASDFLTIGSTLSELGRYDEAIAWQRRALTLLEDELGSDHPSIADALTNLGGTLTLVDQTAEALALLERGLAIRESLGEPDDPAIARLSNNIAGLLAGEGRDAEALPHFARARALLVAQLGEEHPDAATVIANEGASMVQSGRGAQGIAALEQATAIRERTLGPDHVDVAESYYQLGHSLRTLGRLPEARRQLERAIDVLERAQGLEHPRLAEYLGEAARIAIAQGRFADATKQLERAIPLSERALGAEHSGTTILVELAAKARAGAG